MTAMTIMRESLEEGEGVVEGGEDGSALGGDLVVVVEVKLVENVLEVGGGGGGGGGGRGAWWGSEGALEIGGSGGGGEWKMVRLEGALEVGRGGGEGERGRWWGQRTRSRSIVEEGEAVEEDCGVGANRRKRERGGKLGLGERKRGGKLGLGERKRGGRSSREN